MIAAASRALYAFVAVLKILVPKEDPLLGQHELCDQSQVGYDIH